MKNKIRELWWTLTSLINMIILVLQAMYKYHLKWQTAFVYVDDLLKARVKAMEREQKHLKQKARKKIRQARMRHYV